MSKVRVLLFAVILLATASVGLAEEGKISATLDVTYMSKLMDKGGEYYSEDGGFLQTLDLDLWGSGFGVAVGRREATDSGHVNAERLDYKVYYGSSLFDGENYMTNYKLNWIYHHQPDQPKKAGNAQEWEFAFSWPELLPGGLVPSYVACVEYPAGSGYNNRANAGWWHLFGLGYAQDVDGLSNPLNLSGNIAYRDGLGGGAVDHDWSHATFGISTAFGLTEDLTFVPGLFYQISMDESVCTRDVTYVSLSMNYKF